MRTEDVKHPSPGSVENAKVVVQLDPTEIGLSQSFIDFVRTNHDVFGHKAEEDILKEIRGRYAILPE